MTGHVIYACLCLNVQIHLSNKYYLEGHEKYRRDKFVRLEQPRLSGWVFDTGKGIMITYPSLIRVQKMDDWFTINCHNCATEVCSIERKNTKELTTIQHLPGDRLMIHQKAIFGQAIDDLRKNPTYSDIFHIILNPDLPMEYLSMDKDKGFSSSLEEQYEQVQRLLKESCDELERKTEMKIQIYKEEQKLQLAREKEKANYDAAVLWQTMKEVSKTAFTNQNARRLSTLQIKPPPQQLKISDHVTFNLIQQAEKQDNPRLRDLSMDTKEYDMFKAEQRDEHHSVRFDEHHLHPHELDPNHFINQRRRRSSAFKTSNRRSSYILDESAIANSLKKISHQHHPLLPVPERRRSSLQLQQPKVLGSSNSSSSWVDELDKEGEEEEDDDNDSEDVFPLDEDIPESSTFNSGKRRESKKYLDINEDEENEADQDKETDGLYDDDDDDDDEEEEEEDTLAKKFAYTIACSVPISIEQPPKFGPFGQKNNIDQTKEKKTFLGFDYAKADREISSHLPPINCRRKSIASGAIYRNMPGLPDTQNEANGTRNEKIIPPHILVANTYTDGAEAMFGSVPRGSVRYRPVE